MDVLTCSVGWRGSSIHAGGMDQLAYRIDRTGANVASVATELPWQLVANQAIGHDRRILITS